MLLLLLQAEVFESSAVVPPTEPLYDLTEWVATHFPRYGYSAASPFYVWQEAAAQHLGEQGAAAYYATAALMASEPHRSALLKMAAHVSGCQACRAVWVDWCGHQGWGKGWRGWGAATGRPQ